MKPLLTTAVLALVSHYQTADAQPPACSPVVLTNQYQGSSPFVAGPTAQSRVVANPVTQSIYTVAHPYPQSQVTRAYYAPGASYSPAPVPSTYSGSYPALAAPTMAGYAPTPMVANSHYYVGRGIIGQLKLYGSGQPVRNVLRFLTP